MTREYLTFFFPLFTDIRMKAKPNNAIMWFLSILLLFQTMLSAFFSNKPADMIDFNENRDPGVHTLLVFLYVSWYDSTTFSLFDSGVLLLIQLILFALIYAAAKKKSYGFYVSVIHLNLISHMIVIITYSTAVPLYFRVALSLDYLISNHNITGVMSLILVLLTSFFHLMIIYIQSVFLDQFDFIPETTFSLYEGKSSPFFRGTHFLSVLSCFIIPIISNIDVQQGVSFLSLVISIFGLYFRVLPCPHFSILGQFMDTSFLFFTPPILIIKSFLGKFENYLILIFFALEILYFALLYMIRKQISKKSIEIFNIFSNYHVSSSTFSSRSGISPHNYVTVIRFYALTISDPNVFEQFRQMQQLFDKRASIQIEIIRFLGLFPSKRSQMLEEIQNTASKNPYNRFMLHLFSEKLTALTMDSTEADRGQAIDLYSAYAAKLCKYWKCRHRKQKFKSFTNGLIASNLRIELKSELLALIEKYPFDKNVRKMYVNFLLIASGDPEEIKNQKSILNELQGNSPVITDPLLHNVSAFNPRILRYLSKNERETCSCITIVRSRTGQSFSLNNSAENEEKNAVVRSLEKPQRACLITTLIPHIYMAFLLVVFCCLLFEYEYKSSVISEKTFDVNNLTIDRFYISSATFFLPFANIRELIKNSNLQQDPNINPSISNSSEKLNSNTDLNSNSNTNTDLNSNIYLNSNTNMYLNSNSNSNLNSNTYLNSNSNSNTNLNTNTYLNSNSNSNTDLNSNSNTNADLNSNIYLNSNTNTYLNSNSNSNTNLNSNTYLKSNSNSNTDLNSNSNAELQSNKYLNSKLDYFSNLSLNDFDIINGSTSERKNKYSNKFRDIVFQPDQMNDSDCCNYFIDLEEKERDYFSSNPSLIDFSAYCVSSSIEFYLKNKNSTLCELAQSLNDDPSYETEYQFDTMIVSLSNTLNQIQLELLNFTKREGFVSLLILFFVGFVAITIIEFLGFYIYLNSQMSDYSEFFGFLGSDERKDLIEEGKAEESWELLKDKNINSPTFSEVSLRTKNVVHITKPNFLFYFISWFFLFILLFDIAFPHLIRVQSQSNNHKKFEETHKLVEYVIYLMKNITSSILGDPLDVDLCRSISHNLTDSHHPISFHYTTSYITGVNSPHLTVSNLVDLYVNKSLSNSQIEEIFVPNLFDFARYSVIDVFVKEANTREIFHKEAVIAFSLSTFILVVFYLVSGYKRYKRINGSISKLFIFPKCFIEAVKANNTRSNEENDVPDNLLVITIITDTKKIYSVSDNSINIIGKQSSTLINTNFFDLFSPPPDNDPNFLILKMADKKKCKTFKVKVIEKGQITHYLLLDDSSKVLSNLNNVSPASQLSNFMTPFFADQFSSENVRSVLLNDSFFIFIKIKVIGVDINTIESVYTSFFTQLTKLFANVKCIKVEGSLIELAVSNTPSVLTALFLMRDILNNQKSSVGINSVFIDHIDEARFTLNTIDEPCVVCENSEVEKDESTLYMLEINNLALNVSLIEQLPDALKIGKVSNLPTDFSGNNFVSVISYSFNEFLQLMSKSYL